MTQKAKVFISGNSQAVRLPKEYRINGDEVFIRRDPVTGDLILSRKPPSWDGFLDVLKNTTVPPDFMAERDQSVTLRDPFEDRTE